MSEADIRGAMLAGMDAENRRRQLASQTPGLGMQLQLPQSPAAAAVGKSSLDLPAIGEGYDVRAPAAFQHHSYGPDAPVYGPDEVGGYGYPHRLAQPARRSIIADLADRVFGAQDAAAAAPGVVYVSPQAPRRSLLDRLLRRR